MDWENLRHFAALAATGSLSGAARQLGVEHATIARRIAALEAALGLKLVDRRGRRVTLTADGDRIAAITERIELDAQAIERVADGARSELTGKVTISAPPALAAAMLTAPLVELQKGNPGLTIRLVGEVRSVALERREADIAVRLSRPEDGDLTVMKLGEIVFHPYAGAAYLAETPEADWCFIGYDAPMNRSVQQCTLEEFAAGRRFAFETSTSEIQHAAVLAGAGIALLPDFLVAAETSLVRVPQGTPPLVRDVWLVVHTDMKGAALIRTVIKALKKAFSARAANSGDDITTAIA
ncbi:MAG: LysR family transcriptional regulator [Paracoccus denitrificans]|nr:MAG: LysR family transcriptional regulator [Paracoccus denitrificans]PZO83287.1 MAG: LysR family transcriptional regulator [Paracoccus denitrificans]